MIKTGLFVFQFEFDLNPWGVASAKKVSRKRLWKPKKISPRFGRNLFYFSNLFPVLFDRFIVFTSCMLHSCVTAKNGKILTPTPTGNFLLTSNGLEILGDESYSGLRSPGRNLRSGSIFVSLCNNIPAGKAKRKQSLINLLRNLLPTFLIDWHLPNQPTKITSVACFSSVQSFHE